MTLDALDRPFPTLAGAWPHPSISQGVSRFWRDRVLLRWRSTEPASPSRRQSRDDRLT